MRIPGKIIVSIVLLLACMFAFLFMLENRKRSASQRVALGDRKANVVHELGQPVMVFTNDWTSFKYGGEVWAYGSAIDTTAALKGELPFRLRLFSPADGDFLVVFADNGTVLRLTNAPVQTK